MQVSQRGNIPGTWKEMVSLVASVTLGFKQYGASFMNFTLQGTSY